VHKRSSLLRKSVNDVTKVFIISGPPVDDSRAVVGCVVRRRVFERNGLKERRAGQNQGTLSQREGLIPLNSYIRELVLKKVRSIFDRKSSRTKLVSTRRSTVQSLPIQ
jgi:hypothetical protein